jgi:hypothetical protein
MSWVFAAVLLGAGLIAVAPLVVARQPQAQPFFARLGRADAVLGVVLLVAGVLATVRHGFGFLRALGAAPVTGVLGLATLATAIALGFLLGRRWITPFLRSAEARARTQAVSTRLLRWQVPLGAAAVVLAIYWLVVE